MKIFLTIISILFARACNTIASASTILHLSSDFLEYEQPDSTTINLLDKVIITAHRPQIRQEIDRISYDVQTDDESKSQTALDMLRKVPLVTIDGNDNILVKGEGGFKIYKNGHYDLSLSKNAKQVLKGMPASAIKRIEVITEPGAREDAEGVEAILNFVMMDTRKMQGMTGSVNTSTNFRTAPSVSTYLASQYGKAIVSIDYGFIHFTDRGSKGYNHTELTTINTGNTTITDHHRYQPEQIHFGDISASYDIDSLNLITASFGGYFSKKKQHGDVSTTIFDPVGDILSRYNETYWNPRNNYNDWSGRFDYEHSSRREGEKLTLSYMLSLSRHTEEKESFYHDIFNAPFSYSGIYQFGREKFTEHTVQLDYIHPLWTGHKLGVGTKYIDRRNESQDSQMFYDEPIIETDGAFNHICRIAALYADYTWTRGNWATRAGLRYEHSFMKGHYPDGMMPDFSRHLNDWVPQASVQYKFTPFKSLKLSYSTNINRPGIHYLNPYVKTTPTTIEFGNAGLGSTHSQSISLTYVQIGSKFTLQISPMFKFYNNGIDQIVYAEGDIRFYTYKEVLRQRMWLVNGYVQWRPFDKTTLWTSMLFRHTQSENTFQHLKASSNTLTYFVNLSQKIPCKIQASALVMGTIGRFNSIYGYSTPFCTYRFTLQRSFLSDDRLTISLATQNPFRKDLCRTSRFTQGDIVGFSDDYNKGDSRMFVLSASFRFGNLKASVKSTETTIQNTDLEGGLTR